jgi:dienelactone hydrolase
VERTSSPSLPPSAGWRLAVVAGLCALATGAAQARLVEEQHDLPVAVVDAYDKPVAQTIKLTVFFDDSTPQPRPVLVINHGRAADAAGRGALGRARYGDAARWFARFGFAVAVPTRLGYGVSRGEDVEDSGACGAKNYAPGYRASAQQTLAALRFMHERADTLKDRDVVVGQSYGGATSIAVAALNPAGTVAVVNFAGGGGGDPKERAQAPCSPQRLERLFAEYGRTARIPSLWIYAENDMYFGPTLPKAWFNALREAGGVGDFVQVPPQGDDGHATFVRAPTVWQPIVAGFLKTHGFDVKE